MKYRRIEIEPRTVAIGADVSGPDLANLDDDTFIEIKSAQHEHLVLFFHDQDLSPEAHMAFAGRIGEMEIHEVFTPLKNHPQISVLEHDAERPPISDAWHSDVTYRAEPSLASVLHARTIPPNGGDTLWNQCLRRLRKVIPIHFKTMLEQLTGEHDFLQAYGSYFRTLEDGPERIRRAQIENTTGTASAYRRSSRHWQAVTLCKSNVH